MMIRWSVQNGFITIPKSSQKDRIIANSQVFDWFIEEQDFNTVVGLASFFVLPITVNYHPQTKFGAESG